MGSETTVFFKFFEGINSLKDGIVISSKLAEFNLAGRQFTITWYGTLIALGFLLAVLFGGRMAYKWKMNLDKMLDVLIYGTVGGIIGARLYYCIFEWGYYGNHIFEIFRIWEGGLAIYGGLIGGILAAYLTCLVRKMNFRNLLDLAAMSFLIGQGIGRWGNFVNQEAFGTNTKLPWGMWSSKVQVYLLSNMSMFEEKGIKVDAGSLETKAFVHPTFLYESIWCLLGFLVLYLICKHYRKFSGQLMLCYGVWYGTGRTIIEGFRTDSLYVGNTSIRVSQLLSILIAVSCLIALILLMMKYKKNPKPIEGIDYFENEPDDAKDTAAASDDTIIISEETVNQSDAEESISDGETDTENDNSSDEAEDDIQPNDDIDDDNNKNTID